MTKHLVEITDRATGKTLQAIVSEDQYILDAFESQGITLPAACCRGACTTCAVKIKQGTMEQQEAIGLSKTLQQEGYGLICIGYPRSALKLETQAENEVYQLQFGQFYQKQKRPFFYWPFSS